MFGSISGSIVATFYYMFFQIAGFMVATALLKKEKIFTKILIGSCIGSLLLHWLPVLFAFTVDFTISAHILAAVSLLPLIWYANKKRDTICEKGEVVLAVKNNKLFVFLFGCVLLLWCYLLNTHIILQGSDGALYGGQSTYGDMSMHLGFITSIAAQQTFPPMYSIFPGTKLAYPFLNATISSSLLLMGASLRWAYILPMIFAFAQVIAGVYHFAGTVLADKAKAIFCWGLYIFNGGLGFIYFIDYANNGGYTLSDIFTGYYTTPTNLVEHNIRWVNIIADILLPQRASIFGYAMAICALWLLYSAVWKGKKEYFTLAGIFAASLPLIHTHSFLAVVLISAAWLLLYLYRNTVNCKKWFGGHILMVFVLFMCIIQFYVTNGILSNNHLFIICLTGVGLCVVKGRFLLYKYIKQQGMVPFIKSWGIYLAIGVVLSAPQILIWTFGQVAEGGFLRGHFNWGNLGEPYVWFYAKNIGAPIILIVGTICRGGKKAAEMVLPAGVIWFVAELILFTPNTYDNNKLLYIAYMLLCVAAADYGVDFYRRFKEFGGVRLMAACFVVLSTISAVLTLGREAVSEYQIFGAAHVELARYVEENTASADTILTDTRHNNEVAALTGRNIVCGSDIYLYFHGISTSQRKEDVRMMYENPADNITLFGEYGVDYILVSSYERNYHIDYNWINSNCTKVFSLDGVELYKLGT